MEKINKNLTLQRLSGWVIEQVQKSLGIAGTARLRVPTDNYEFWGRSGDGIQVYPYGQASNRRTAASIEITYDYQRAVALFWCDGVTSLVRAERQLDFDPLDLPDSPAGEINVEVLLDEGIDRIQIWETLPARPLSTTINQMPRVVGLV